jgi:hypothetical protein
MLRANDVSEVNAIENRKLSWEIPFVEEILV